MIQRATWRPGQTERYSGSYSWKKRRRLSNTCLLLAHPFPDRFCSTLQSAGGAEERCARLGDSRGRRPPGYRLRGEPLRGRADARGVLGGVMICCSSTTHLAVVFLLQRFSARQRLASSAVRAGPRALRTPFRRRRDPSPPTPTPPPAWLLLPPPPGSPSPVPSPATCSPRESRRQAKVLTVLMKMANNVSFPSGSTKGEAVGNAVFLSGLAMKLISPNY